MIRVATSDAPGRVALLVREALLRNDVIVMQVVGAGALNQAIKALVIARRDSGRNLVAAPEFGEAWDRGGQQLTCIRLLIRDAGELPEKPWESVQVIP